ncbi:hypothetical protein [Butyrivibrio sp. LC3010]|uniref:hypothetical protein n=1 Tax=Butyrivibrio sp. LC3010 TaxID=1280680 RepID=UPI00047AB5BF|nr:hypothetical protein [Butyrivibrio sp. LC3010]
MFPRRSGYEEDHYYSHGYVFFIVNVFMYVTITRRLGNNYSDATKNRMVDHDNNAVKSGIFNLFKQIAFRKASSKTE